MEADKPNGQRLTVWEGESDGPSAPRASPPRLCVLGIPKGNASEANSFSRRLHRLLPKGLSREEPQRP